MPLHTHVDMWRESNTRMRQTVGVYIMELGNRYVGMFNGLLQVLKLTERNSARYKKSVA